MSQLLSPNEGLVLLKFVVFLAFEITKVALQTCFISFKNQIHSENNNCSRYAKLFLYVTVQIDFTLYVQTQVYTQKETLYLECWTLISQLKCFLAMSV